MTRPTPNEFMNNIIFSLDDNFDFDDYCKYINNARSDSRNREFLLLSLSVFI